MLVLLEHADISARVAGTFGSVPSLLVDQRPLASSKRSTAAPPRSASRTALAALRILDASFARPSPYAHPLPRSAQVHHDPPFSQAIGGRSGCTISPCAPRRRRCHRSAFPVAAQALDARAALLGGRSARQGTRWAAENWARVTLSHGEPPSDRHSPAKHRLGHSTSIALPCAAADHTYADGRASADLPLQLVCNVTRQPSLRWLRSGARAHLAARGFTFSGVEASRIWLLAIATTAEGLLISQRSTSGPTSLLASSFAIPSASDGELHRLARRLHHPPVSRHHGSPFAFACRRSSSPPRRAVVDRRGLPAV